MLVHGQITLDPHSYKKQTQVHTFKTFNTVKFQMVNKTNVRLCEAPAVPEKQLKKEAEDNQFSKSTIHIHKHTPTHTHTHTHTHKDT